MSKRPTVSTTNRLASFLGVALLLVLCLILLAFIVLDRRERREEQERLEGIAGTMTVPIRPPATTDPTPPEHLSTLSGYQRLKEAVDFHMFFFGDRPTYGYGATYGYARMVKTHLAERYHLELGTDQAGCDQNAPLATQASNFLTYHTNTQRPRDYQLAFLCAGEANERDPDPESADAALTATALFIRDYEALIRTVKSAAPTCDIVCVIQHSEAADSPRAAAITALAEHYGLVLVDMRAIFAADGRPLSALTVEVEEGDLRNQYPNNEGHTLYADAICAAVEAAAEAERAPSPLPEQPLYPQAAE